MTHRPQPLLLPTQRNIALAALHTYRGAERWQCEPLTTLEAGELLADVYEMPGYALLIAVRGTANMANWLYDVDVALRPSDYLDGRVHRGFAAASEEITEPLRRWMSGQGSLIGRRVELCGHSLGGAIVTYLAPWLVMQGVAVSGVTTYGSPRVGDAGYVRAWNRWLSDVSRRVVHSADLVPLLPMALMGYRHVGGERVYFDRHGRRCMSARCRWVDRVLADLADVFVNGERATDYHEMAGYLRCIEGQPG